MQKCSKGWRTCWSQNCHIYAGIPFEQEMYYRGIICVNHWENLVQNYSGLWNRWKL